MIVKLDVKYITDETIYSMDEASVKTLLLEVLSTLRDGNRSLNTKEDVCVAESLPLVKKAATEPIPVGEPRKGTLVSVTTATTATTARERVFSGVDDGDVISGMKLEQPTPPGVVIVKTHRKSKTPYCSIDPVDRRVVWTKYHGVTITTPKDKTKKAVYTALARIPMMHRKFPLRVGISKVGDPVDAAVIYDLFLDKANLPERVFPRNRNTFNEVKKKYDDLTEHHKAKLMKVINKKISEI